MTPAQPDTPLLGGPAPATRRHALAALAGASLAALRLARPAAADDGGDGGGVDGGGGGAGGDGGDATAGGHHHKKHHKHRR